MRRTIFTAGAVGAALLAAGCASGRAAGDGMRLAVVAQAVADWRPFRSGVAHFGIEFPADPAPTSESWSLPGGSVEMVGTRFADASYLVSVVEAREAFSTAEARASALEMYPAEMVSRLQGAVVSDERREVAGWPARSVEIAADRGVTRVLIVPTSDRLYLVGVATRGEALPGEAARFLRSFRPE